MCPAAADWARRREELFACALELMQSNSPTPTTDHSPGVWVEGCGLDRAVRAQETWRAYRRKRAPRQWAGWLARIGRIVGDASCHAAVVW